MAIEETTIPSGGSARLAVVKEDETGKCTPVFYVKLIDIHGHALEFDDLGSPGSPAVPGESATGTVELLSLPNDGNSGPSFNNIAATYWAATPANPNEIVLGETTQECAENLKDWINSHSIEGMEIFSAERSGNIVNITATEESGADGNVTLTTAGDMNIEVTGMSGGVTGEAEVPATHKYCLPIRVVG